MHARHTLGRLALGSFFILVPISACSSSGAPSASVDGGQDGSTAGEVSLSALSVATSSGKSLALSPSFSGDIHDYYVRCAAGTNALQVSMTASPGATSALTEPTASPAKASQRVSVSVDENAASVAYWVRCLPPDFPAVALTTFPTAGDPAPGYYLIGNATVSVGEGGYAMVVDVHGVPVWYHPVTADLAVTDVETLIPGKISFITTSFAAYEPFEIQTLSPLAHQTIAPDGATTDEHELRVLANGHYLVFSYPPVSNVDLTGVAITKGFDAGVVELGPNSTIQDCELVEFDASGKVAWEWSASAHFDPAKVSTYPQTSFGPSVVPDGGKAYDVFHCNSVDEDPANGNLLVSARGTDSVFYIEKSSGKVLWKMGGTKSSKDPETVFVSVTDPFFRQHDARLLPGWEPTCHGGTGQISMFDDETAEPGPARGVVYDVVVGGGTGDGCGDAGAGASPGEAKVTWQYAGNATSGGAGSVRSTSTGGRVVGWGIGTPILTEVGQNGEKLVELAFPSGDISYRAVKVPSSAFDLDVLRMTAGK